MKRTTLSKLVLIGFTAILAACSEKKDDHADHDHDHDHAGHDHAGHDHADHDHGKKSDKHDDHEGHDHGDDHANCGVVVGPKGGRMIEEVAELNLTDGGEVTLTFGAEPAKEVNVTILADGTPLALTQSGSVFKSESISDKLPVELHVAIKDAVGKKTVAKFKLESGTCGDCKNKKLACTCHNHEH